jgi:signal transduction histidine kinase
MKPRRAWTALTHLLQPIAPTPPKNFPLLPVWTLLKDDCMAPAIHLPQRLDSSADLETVLAAWHSATLRLEYTHEALRTEVQRLTSELEVKNRELARKNRLADLGQMASHIAHEVRNNLVPVTLYLSLLRRRLSDDRGSCDVLDKVASGFTAVDACVNDLLHFTADREPRCESVNVEQLVEEVLASLGPQMAAQEISAVVEVADAPWLSADREMLRRALLNLTLNAVDAMPGGGRLYITACQGPRGFELEVADTGAGLCDEARLRAFEPFFSTKSHGTGLGLAIVERIAEAHGGDCLAQNCPDGGAAFTLCIPRKRQSMEAAA